MAEPISSVIAGKTVDLIVGALFGMFYDKAVATGARHIGTRLKLGSLDPNHHIARAARLAQLNAAAWLVDQERSAQWDAAMAANPGLKLAQRGPDPEITAAYDRARAGLRRQIDHLHKSGHAEHLPEGGYALVETAVHNLLAAEAGAQAACRAALIRHTLEEVVKLGNWPTAPEGLARRFADEQNGFTNAFAASIAALLKSKDWDEFFRIWLVLRQQATNETLAEIVATLTDLSVHAAERDAAAIAIAGSEEGLTRMQGQLARIEDKIDTVPDRTADKVIARLTSTGHLRTRLPPRINIVEDLDVAPGRLFGRDAERDMLRQAVASCAAGADPALKTDFVVLHAFGGAGKTALLRRLIADLAPGFTPFEAVIGWSAYSQGSHDNANTDAKGFIDKAIAFLDPAADVTISERDSGRKLAELMRATPTLLLLDGIEPLQYPTLVKDGFLKDPALAALVKSLSLGHPGLVVITSRQPLPELAGQAAPAVINHHLESLSPAAGADLLKSLGCHGTTKTLEAASADVLDHALSLTLLGTYIAEFKGGDISRRDHFRFADLVDRDDEADPTARPARRTAAIVTAYLHQFAEEEARAPKLGGVERTLLSITGLFDRPADGKAVRLLLDGDVITGLTDAVHAMPPRDREDIIARAARRLRKLGLLTSENTNDKAALDSHPIIRDHFSKHLKAEAPEAFREAHARLYRHYAAQAPDQPDNIKAMEPLFHAIGHACAAEEYQEARSELYRRRIRRENQSFINNQLGANAADLAVLANFFERAWDAPRADFSVSERAWLLSCASFALCNLNRLPEAVAAQTAALQTRIEEENWDNAARAAGSLFNMQSALGRITEALAMARRAVDWADRSADNFQMMSKRAALGRAFLYLGDSETALEWFADAERRQGDGAPAYPRLYSLQGYLYCDLMFDLGRYDEARDRAIYALDISIRNGWLRNVGLDTLSHARAEAALADTPEATLAALPLFNRAVAALDRADDTEYSPLGFLARATHLRRLGRFAAAADDLGEVYNLAHPGGMRLYLTDYHLESARLALAQIPGTPAEARIPRDPPPETPPPPDPEPRTEALTPDEGPHLKQAIDHTDKAATLIQETGYHRRDRELADLRRRIAYLQDLK